VMIVQEEIVGIRGNDLAAILMPPAWTERCWRPAGRMPCSR